jgi:hypothetical protein
LTCKEINNAYNLIEKVSEQCEWGQGLVDDVIVAQLHLRIHASCAMMALLPVLTLHYVQNLGISSLARYVSNSTSSLMQKIHFAFGEAGKRLFVAQLHLQISSTLSLMAQPLLMTSSHLPKNENIFLVSRTLTLSSS